MLSFHFGGLVTGWGIEYVWVSGGDPMFILRLDGGKRRGGSHGGLV